MSRVVPELHHGKSGRLAGNSCREHDTLRMPNVVRDARGGPCVGEAALDELARHLRKRSCVLDSCQVQMAISHDFKDSAARRF